MFSAMSSTMRKRIGLSGMARLELGAAAPDALGFVEGLEDRRMGREAKRLVRAQPEEPATGQRLGEQADGRSCRAPSK